MIIVDERNSVEKELDAKGFSLFDFFEQHTVLDVKAFSELPLQRRSDIVLIDTESLLQKPALQEAFKTVMNTYLGVIFFHDQKNVKAQSWVQDHAAFLTKILGEYSLPMPQLQWTMLSNQLQFFFTLVEDQKKLQKHLLSFSQELDVVLQSAETEMTKAKRVHEQLIPKRSEEIKGVSFRNKYMAGDGGGGEFYDLISTSQKVFQVLISSQSYLISSALMGLLSQHKQKEFNADSFLADAHTDVATINSTKKEKSEVDISILELDLTNLTMGLRGSQRLEVYSVKSGHVHFGDHAHQLTRGEKLVLLSPGFMANWKHAQPGQSVHAFILAQLKANDLMTELFYQIRPQGDADSSKKDATLVMMEVNRHGIHEV